MKLQKTKIFCLIFLVISSIAFSQNGYYHALMDNVFNIPAHKVTTGVLINRALPLIDMRGYNGERVDVCNPSHWLEIFYTLYSAHLDSADFKYDLTINTKRKQKNIAK